MKLLSFMPKATPELVSRLKSLVHSEGLTFQHGACEEEVERALCLGQGKERVVLFSDTEHLEFVRGFAHRHPESFIVLLLRSPLPSIARGVADLLPVSSFLATDGDDFDGRDASAILKKLLTRDILGMEKYLGAGTDIRHNLIRCPTDKALAVQSVMQFVRVHCAALARSEDAVVQHHASRVREVLEELVLNAVFNANPRYERKPCSTPFLLAEEEAVHVKWGSAGDVFAISVSDSFGRFQKQTIVKYLDETLSVRDLRPDGGGGLGLKLIYSRLHNFVVNVRPGKVTEVICLFKFERRLRDLGRRMRSFHYFSHGTGD